MIKIILFFICAFSYITDYKAESIKFIDEFYSNVIINDITYSNQLNYVLNEDKILFCLDCNNNISYLKQDDINYIKLISNYTNKKIQNNNIYYYMAAHELIWEQITNNDFFWTDKYNNIVDISELKQEINLYVEKFFLKPSFDSTIIKDNFYTTIKLDDKNKVLDEYEILNESNNIVWKEDNKLYIKILSSKLSEIKLIKKIQNDSIHYSMINKDVIEFNDNIENSSVIYVQANDIYMENINFNFLDRKELKFINNIEFKITNLNSNNTFNLTITNGCFNKKLESGIYKLEILNVDNNYLIPPIINFEVSENNIYFNDRTINIYFDENYLLYKNNKFKKQNNFSTNERFLPKNKLQTNNKYTISPFKLIIFVLFGIGILYFFKDKFNE